MNTKYHGNYTFTKVREVPDLAIAQLPDLGRHHTELFQMAEKKLRNTENQIIYLPHVEYDLAIRGISKEALQNEAFSDTTIAQLRQLLQVDYLLLVKLASLKSYGSTYGYYTDLDLNPYNSPLHHSKESRTGKLYFTLIDLTDGTISRQFSVATTINPLIINEKANGEHRVNITTKEKAGFIAFKKGLKKL